MFWNTVFPFWDTNLSAFIHLVASGKINNNTVSVFQEVAYGKRLCDPWAGISSIPINDTLKQVGHRITRRIALLNKHYAKYLGS